MENLAHRGGGDNQSQVNKKPSGILGKYAVSEPADFGYALTRRSKAVADPKEMHWEVAKKERHPESVFATS
jgi:hypothetical protein